MKHASTAIYQLLTPARQRIGLPLHHAAQILGLTDHELRCVEDGDVPLSPSWCRALASLYQLDDADIPAPSLPDEDRQSSQSGGRP